MQRAAASSGAPLQEDTSAYLAAALGTDLSGVRVHTDGEAAAAADAYHARAFTHGHDIYFAHGEYDPHSAAGQRLLYHEVAHTVQQGHAGPAMQGKLRVSQPGDPSEREADRVADALIAGDPAPRIESRGAGAIQRETADEQSEPALAEEIEARVRELLEMPIPPGDANAVAARRTQLVQCFRDLDAQSRQALLSRLQRRGDPLGAVFSYGWRPRRATRCWTCCARRARPSHETATPQRLPTSDRAVPTTRPGERSRLRARRPTTRGHISSARLPRRWASSRG